MRDESDDVRVVAARSLAAIGDPAAVDALTAALADPSRWTATTVAADLVEMGPAAVPTLIDIASAADSEQPGAHEAAVTAVRVLGEIRDPRAEPVLIRLLKAATDLNVRARAAAALGAVGGPLAPSALRDRPATTTPGRCAPRRRRAWARSATATASGRSPPRSRTTAGGSARNCAEALGELGEPGRRALRRLARSSDRYVRDCCDGVLQQLELDADESIWSPALPETDA